MRTHALRRALPRPLRKIYRRFIPRTRGLRRHVDRGTGTRHVVLPLPRAQGVQRWMPARRVLTLNVPAKLWVAKALEEKGLANYESEALSVFLALIQRAGESAAFFDVGSNIGP